jgi:hypothetical protein
MELGRFQYDHTPVLTIYSDYVNIWGASCTHDQLLNGECDEAIISMFSDEALDWAVALVKNYQKDPVHYSRRKDLYKFFHHRLRYDSCNDKEKIIGKIDFPSGEIVVSDGYVFELEERPSPLVRKVKKGNYELKLYFNFKDECLLAQVVFLKEVPVDFEIAKTIYDEQHATGSPAISVLSGAVFLSDHSQLDLYSNYFKKEENKNNIKKTPEQAIFSNLESIPGIIPVKLKEGIYSCYWGLNKNEKIVCLVIDFGKYIS